MALKANDIKKMVILDHNAKYVPAGLFVNEHDGEMWATNKYWVTRAERVAPLLEQYNLKAAGPGSYEVNGTVRPATGAVNGIPVQPPDVGRLIKDAKDFEPGTPVRIAGQLAYTRGDRGLFAAFLLTDGRNAGLRADELEWLADTATAPLPEGYRYGDVSVLFPRNAQGGVAAMVQAETFRVIERGHYDSEAHDYVPAVEEPAEPRVLGLMMAMTYGA